VTYLLDKLHLIPPKNFTYFINLASSIDGYIARIGERTNISTEEDWKVVMKLRSEIDAIIVGSNTVRVDNPHLLTKTKYLEGKEVHHPIRVILDRSGKLDLHYAVFQSEESPVIWITSKKITTPDHVRIVPCEPSIDMEQIVQLLNSELTKYRKSGFVMVEGGSHILAEFLKHKLVSRMRIFRGSLLLGVGVPILPESVTISMKLIEIQNLGGGIEEIWALEA